MAGESATNKLNVATISSLATDSTGAAFAGGDESDYKKVRSFEGDIAALATDLTEELLLL